MKNFYDREWTMAEKVLLTTATLLFGVVIGFMFAPIKKGVYCGNHNGNTQLPQIEE